MNDDPKRALREAEEWLASARDKLAEAEEFDYAANVCCAQTIHAIIRANDALALKFSKTKPFRHDEVSFTFQNLIRDGKLRKEELRFTRFLEKAMASKSGADYGEKSFSLEDAKWFVARTEEFVEMVKSYLK